MNEHCFNRVKYVYRYSLLQLANRLQFRLHTSLRKAYTLQLPDSCHFQHVLFSYSVAAVSQKLCYTKIMSQK